MVARTVVRELQSVFGREMINNAADPRRLLEVARGLSEACDRTRLLAKGLVVFAEDLLDRPRYVHQIDPSKRPTHNLNAARQRLRWAQSALAEARIDSARYGAAGPAEAQNAVRVVKHWQGQVCDQLDELWEAQEYARRCAKARSL